MLKYLDISERNIFWSFPSNSIYCYDYDRPIVLSSGIDCIIGSEWAENEIRGTYVYKDGTYYVTFNEPCIYK